MDGQILKHSDLHGGDLSTLTAINCARVDALQEREKAVTDHAANLKRLDAIVEDCRKREALLLADLDLERIERARKIISAGNLWQTSSEWNGREYVRASTDFTKPAVDKRVFLIGVAVNDVATAADQMKRRYFGLKDYDQWSHQREDHEYGMGPRHGSIVFRIGLTDEARKEPGLTMQQRDDAIYYLRNLERIQRAEGAK